jgi:type VI secretion system secreted protein VgrG
VLGNLFHAQNKQGANYTNPVNNLKGMQTAGGNKFVMSDTQGQQKILISNSNNKGTAVEVGFKGDGSITIKSNGPVTVLSPTITLEAGDKGSIKLHAKTITMVAEDEIAASSKSKSITLKAKQNIVATATEKMELHGEQAARLTSDQRAGLTSPQTVDVGSGQTVNISASVVNQS